MLELPAFPQKVASKYGCIELNHRSSISAPTIQITFPKQGKSSFWVHKNSKVIKEGFRGLWVVTSLFEFNDWKDIKILLEDHFPFQNNH